MPDCCSFGKGALGSIGRPRQNQRRSAEHRLGDTVLMVQILQGNECLLTGRLDKVRSLAVMP